jgi:putative addiction module component (TIGR02574 family)
MLSHLSIFTHRVHHRISVSANIRRNGAIMHWELESLEKIHAVDSGIITNAFMQLWKLNLELHAIVGVNAYIDGKISLSKASQTLGITRIEFEFARRCPGGGSDYHGLVTKRGDILMTTAILEITKQAMALPADERVTLALQLWESVEGFVDSDVERAWSEEVERRWSEIQNGTVECLPAETVMQQARASLKQ